MQNRRTSVDVSGESYLDLLARGCRSGYLRLAVNERLVSVRAAIAALRKSRGDEEIASLLEDASVPAARMCDTGLVQLGDLEMRAIELLWAEEEATGLDGAALLEALDSGRVA